MAEPRAGGKGNGQRLSKAYELPVVTSEDFVYNLLIIGKDTVLYT